MLHPALSVGWSVSLPVGWSVDRLVSRSLFTFSKVFSFLGSGPKAPMSCTTQGGISGCPDVPRSVHPSIPHPPWPSKPQILTLRPDLGPLSPQISPPGLKYALQASNQLSRSKISSSGLKSALQTSNQGSRPQIRLPGLKSDPNASSRPKILNLIFRPKIFPPDLISCLDYLLGLIYSPLGRLEIPLYVLQDALVTSSTAPAHPHATRVIVYPALFFFVSFFPFNSEKISHPRIAHGQRYLMPYLK